jgi:hypothetical protein
MKAQAYLNIFFFYTWLGSFLVGCMRATQTTEVRLPAKTFLSRGSLLVDGQNHYNYTKGSLHHKTNVWTVLKSKPPTGDLEF